MKLREDLNALTPRLRRFARALTTGAPGGSERADDLVHATLIRALGSRNSGAHADLVIRLYATLTQMHREIAEPEPAGTTVAKRLSPIRALAASQQLSAAVHPSKLTLGLMSLPLEEREALLLVALENFDHDEAARILHVTKAVLLARLTRARLALETHLHVHPGVRPQHGDHQRGHASHLRLVK